jgi:hypothetical protein
MVTNNVLWWRVIRLVHIPEAGTTPCQLPAYSPHNCRQSASPISLSYDKKSPVSVTMMHQLVSQKIIFSQQWLST